ncbi:hypothetical protein IVB18_40045 [Bradyrhizobium sp. 186]|uniref:hypothetical protein n=1 Tax=Bradyrhizobium sp. 186 TaxID=2782654 RepID=UPI002001147D|nr:hypothetical protein [Bradyrhizobium sp. 186]UPK34264.1 hypothetical protein IVB18_40045 [Bradyrhizobium sp. 186]
MKDGEAVWTKPHPRGAYDVDQCAIARAYRVPVATIAFLAAFLSLLLHFRHLVEALATSGS